MWTRHLCRYFAFTSATQTPKEEDPSTTASPSHSMNRKYKTQCGHTFFYCFYEAMMVASHAYPRITDQNIIKRRLIFLIYSVDASSLQILCFHLSHPNSKGGRSINHCISKSYLTMEIVQLYQGRSIDSGCCPLLCPQEGTREETGESNHLQRLKNHNSQEHTRVRAAPTIHPE